MNHTDWLSVNRVKPQKLTNVITKQTRTRQNNIEIYRGDHNFVNVPVNTTRIVQSDWQKIPLWDGIQIQPRPS